MATKSSLEWSKNIWMGVTIETAKHVDRIDYLRKVPSAVRFISLEPPLGPLPELDLNWKRLPMMENEN